MESEEVLDMPIDWIPILSFLELNSIDLILIQPDQESKDTDQSMEFLTIPAHMTPTLISREPSQDTEDSEVPDIEDSES